MMMMMNKFEYKFLLFHGVREVHLRVLALADINTCCLAADFDTSKKNRVYFWMTWTGVSMHDK